MFSQVDDLEGNGSGVDDGGTVDGRIVGDCSTQFCKKPPTKKHGDKGPWKAVPQMADRGLSPHHSQRSCFLHKSQFLISSQGTGVGFGIGAGVG